MSEFLDAAQAEPYVAPVATPPGHLFFTYQKPDGETFIATAANVEQYLRQGFTVTGEQEIEDSNEHRDLISPGSNEPPASGVDHIDEVVPPETPPA